MRTFRRRGIFLTQLVALLPIIAALIAVAIGITVRVVRFEGRVNRQSAEDSTLTDLARRIQLDARRAVDAKLERGEKEASLQFPSAVYQFTGHRVVRTEPPSASPSAVWTFDDAEAGVQLESIGGTPRLVWLTIQFPLPTQQGPPIARVCSMAATIGEGGGP